MNHLNNILLEGNLLADPKLIVTAPDGENWGSMVKFDIASHKLYKSLDGESKDDVLIISCIAFGSLADKVMSVIKCGMQVRVLGRLRCSKWVTKEGEEKKTFEIVTEHVEFRKRVKKEEKKFAFSDDEQIGQTVSEDVFHYEFF